MKIVLATGNKGKIKEYESLLAPLGAELLLASSLGIDMDVEENGSDYRSNALIKARHVRKFTSLPVLSDDSGLEILALDRFPGLKTGRFASTMGGYPNAFQEVFRRLEGKKRDAQFVCTICFLPENEDTPLFFEGVCPGEILTSVVGENGFGYDPIFYSYEAAIPLGEASEEIKDRYSHRGKASQKLLEYLLSKRNG